MATGAHGESQAKNLVGNGSLEANVNGWMYHQWAGKTPPGSIVKTTAYEGEGSFCMHEANNAKGRYFAREIKIDDPSLNYILAFALKTEGMEPGTARVRLSIDGRGWLSGAGGKPDLLSVGGTQGWKLYGFAVPASKLRNSKKATLFFYHDKLNQGKLYLDAVSFSPGEAEDIPAGAKPTVLQGATSKPNLSTFIAGETVNLTFKVSGLMPHGEPMSLNLNVADEHDRSLATDKLEVVGDDKGEWKTTWQVPSQAPSQQLGFYRVYAELSNGIQLQARGSRKAGFLTYAVVPDPEVRQDYGEAETRFGMQGGFGPWRSEVLSYLGARWILNGNLDWKKQEPKAGTSFDPETAKKWIPKRKPKWQVYSLPTLFIAPKWATKAETYSYNTGELTPEGEKAWDAYCRKAAKAYMMLQPDREERIYQITWEPIQPWGYKGSDEALVRIYEIAYAAIHETDSKAAVAGPTRGLDKNEVHRTTRLLKLGLGKYLDIYSVHPYFSTKPEKEGMPSQLVKMREALELHTGKTLPMIGTEQGGSTHENPDEDLLQAQTLIRQNLITLGEGYRFNMGYFIVDYRLAGQKGYGYYYNLMDGIP